MWELERESDLQDLTRIRCAIVGNGRVGRALTRELRAAGIAVDGPLGRGWAPPAQPVVGGAADVVILAVPDGEIAAAAAAIAPRPGRLVGHCSGATTLAVLAPHEAFSLHPLMTVTHAASTPVLAGAAAATAGTTERAHDVAVALAVALGMTPVRVADEDRAAYHAAASIASNFLVTLQAAAERVASSAGVERAAIVPLVRATLENWAEHGPERALTGPLVRGDEATVARQRDALLERTPELLPLFDALADATRDLAQSAGADSVARSAGAELAAAPAPLAHAAGPDREARS